MIKYFLLFLFLNGLSCRVITSEMLTLIKQNRNQFIDNQVFNFLSGLLNDPMLLSSKEMIECLIRFTKFKENEDTLILLLEMIINEATTVVESNVYSHLNHKFKICDINNDTSQKLSVYFIDKLRGIFRNLMLYPTLNTARQVLLCYKKGSNTYVPYIFDEYFLNIDRYIKGYPETFCQLKQIKDYLFSLRLKSYDVISKYFHLGEIVSIFFKTLMQHRRKCVNVYSDKDVLLSYFRAVK